ncbi:Transport inhibitor response 1-like protein [Camellia lanceoleosa]|uniref:Transport inhibitor response 1-like protein n=1 Tax=Camellia lanceoleosa TaxID=1840588 RepID=A0ACC0I0J2_9ERIC|nr:Transport inhibitor response 1-like protein [Camellia lanceoleosa]
MGFHYRAAEKLFLKPRSAGDEDLSAMGYHYRGAEKLCLKRMSAGDEDLELRDSLPYFKELVLVCMRWLCTSGLAVIANNCRDLQSYLSHLSLFLAPESKKFYILVDNRPWLNGLGPLSALICGN